MLHQEQLSNGMHVLGKKISSDQALYMKLYIVAGALFDGFHPGLAHFIEHLLFTGTKRFPNRIAFGKKYPQIEAGTNCYTITLSSFRIQKYVRETLETMRDMVSNEQLVFTKQTVLDEKEIVVSEISDLMGDPNEVRSTAIYICMTPNHRFSLPNIGTKSTVMAINYEIVREFIATQFIPARMILVLEGNYDDTVLAQVRDIFGELQNPPGYLQSFYPINHWLTNLPNADFRKQDSLVMRQIPLAGPVRLDIVFPGARLLSENKPAEHMFMNLLGVGMDSDMFAELREKRGLCYTCGAVGSYYVPAGVNLFSISVDPGKYKQALEILNDIFLKYKNEGFIEADLERGKSRFEEGLLLDYNGVNPYNAAEDLYLYGKVHTVEECLKRIHSITLDDLNTTAKRILNQNKAFVLNVGPTISEAHTREILTF